MKSNSKSHPAPATYAISPSSFRVKDVPKTMRPRELMDQLGVEAVEEYVLLAILLRSGVKGMSVIDLSRLLLKEFGSLTALARASVDDLKRRGLGKIKAQVLKAALELARRLAHETAPETRPVKTPEDAAALLREEARPLEQEKFWIVPLNTRNYLKGLPLDITSGLLDASLVHAREVFRDAIRAGSAAVILVHNHPSGDPAPSAEDIRITRQLVAAGRVIEIRVLDHVILGKAPAAGEKDFFSLREAGIVDFT
jgi:DNA repair protein RadC